jgi:hypothetical protein
MSAMIFVTGALLTVWLAPLVAGAFRSGLAERRRASRVLEPVAFGPSPRVRRSPRHAVLRHRGLLASFFTALVALALLPAAIGLGALGRPLIPIALAFAMPALLVTLHARRRGQDL